MSENFQEMFREIMNISAALDDGTDNSIYCTRCVKSNEEKEMEEMKKEHEKWKKKRAKEKSFEATILHLWALQQRVDDVDTDPLGLCNFKYSSDDLYENFQPQIKKRRSKSI